LPGILEDFERSIIEEVYEKHHSSYKVAEELGISQSAATRKIKKYIQGPDLKLVGKFHSLLSDKRS